MSGAGRSEAAHVLEDLGYFVIDNLPPMLIGKVAELARSTEKPIRYALVVDVRSGDFLHDLSGAIDELRTQRRAHPRAVPRRFRRSARPPLRGEPPPPPAVRHRPRQRRHRPRTRAARTAQGRSRPHRRHVEPQRARAPRPAARAVLRTRRRRRAAGERRVVRLQARPADRRRPRLRLPLPARTRTGSTSCARSPASTRRCATTCSAGPGREPFLAQLDSLLGADAAGLRTRGQGLPVDRRRVHRRTASQRRRRRSSSANGCARHGYRPTVHHRDVDRDA